jgi:hypothetical protein
MIHYMIKFKEYFLFTILLPVLWSTSIALGAEAPGTNQAVPKLSVVRDEAHPNDPISMGSEVLIDVTDLAKWLAREKKKLSDLVFYLDDVPFKNTPIKALGNDRLAIRLQQMSDSKTEWSRLLGRPTQFTRPYKLSIGLAESEPLPAQEIKLQVISPGWFSFYVALLVVLLGLFGWLASHSNIIRDSTTLPTSAAGYKPYSLAKFQMAVWFFLILAAFLFIWIITGQYDSITPQVLGLMGIASGTALGAALIEDNKNRSATNELTEMRPRCTAIEQDIEILKDKIADLKRKIEATTPADPKDLDVLKQTQAELEVKGSLWAQIDSKMKDAQSRMSEPSSTNFLADLLSDANGYSFHRFQIFAWTIVLGILFVRAVWAELAMPQFSETLLALMGVSAGTYLGFKFPERPSDPSVPRPSAQPQPRQS